MIADDQIVGADNRFEKIKAGDDQIKTAGKRSRQGMIRSRLSEKDQSWGMIADDQIVPVYNRFGTIQVWDDPR